MWYFKKVSNMAEDTSKLQAMKFEKSDPVLSDDTEPQNASVNESISNEKMDKHEIPTAVIAEINDGCTDLVENYQSNVIIVEPVILPETETCDTKAASSESQSVMVDELPTPLKRGRKASGVFSVYITAVLPETTSCNAFGINSNTQLSNHGLGTAPAELIGGTRVRSRFPLTWTMKEIDNYIHEQFPAIKEYDMMRSGLSKILHVLPAVNTPDMLRDMLGRSVLYIRPKGTLTDMGISEDVMTKPVPKKTEVVLEMPTGKKRGRGRPMSLMLGLNIVALTKDIVTAAMIDFQKLKRLGLGIPNSEQQRGYAREKSQVPLKWTKEELREFISKLFPALSEFELLRAVGRKCLEPLPDDMMTPHGMKGKLVRCTLYVRATGPLNDVSKQPRRARQAETKKQNDVTPTRSTDPKIQATDENIDKLKAILSNNFQSVLGSTVAFEDSISILANIKLVVDAQKELSFEVNHQWSSPLGSMTGGTARWSVGTKLKEEPLDRAATAAGNTTEAGQRDLRLRNPSSLSKHTGDTTEEDEGDEKGGGEEAVENVDSDATYEPDSDELQIVERWKLVKEEAAERNNEEADSGGLDAGVDPGGARRGGKRKHGGEHDEAGVVGVGRGKRRGFGQGGKKGRPAGFTGYIKRKKFEDQEDPPWDEAKVEEYIKGTHRKLTQQRIDKYGTQFADALKAVKTRRLNVRAAASTFNLPYGVLWEEVNHSRFQCKECTKTFAVACHLARHLNSHLVSKAYECKDCGKCFTCNENLQRHLIVHTTNMVHICELCGESFRWKTGLTRHILRHKGERKFVCKVCSKGFYTQFDLMGHLKLHSGEKNFVCSACGIRFVRCSSLNSHMASVHNEERDSVCPECNKGFKNKHALRRHMRFHTGATKYSCDVCGEAFKWHTSRKIHMKKHEQKVGESLLMEQQPQCQQKHQHQQHHPQEAPNHPQGVPKYNPQGNPQGVPQHHLQGHPHDAQQEHTQHHPQGLQRDLPQGTPQHYPLAHPQGAQQDIPQCTRQNLLDQQQKQQYIPAQHQHILSLPQLPCPSSTPSNQPHLQVPQVQQVQVHGVKTSMETPHIVQNISVSAPLVLQQPMVVMSGDNTQSLVHPTTLSTGQAVYTITLPQQLHTNAEGHIVLN